MNALLKPFNVFLRLESTAGLLLFLMAIIAIVIANTTYADAYHHFFEQPVALSFQTHVFTKSVLFWINDIFMALFFLLVGLEIKNEMIDGALNTAKKAALPAIAAIGGMFVPALIYVLINHSIAAYLQGWAIPTATDIAFSLAILSLFGKRIPIGLKIFLTALAIFDDIGAILIIAVYYHSHISLYIVGVVACLLITFLLNITRCYYFFLYALLGIALWICLYQSGIHPTITGVFIRYF
jgi:NhaA family Na+:H+ antiporter